MRDEVSPTKLIEQLLAQPGLPFQLLLDVFRACPEGDIFARNREEKDPRKQRAINKVIKERYEGFDC